MKLISTGVVYLVRCSPRWRRAAQECSVWVLMGRIQAPGLRCTTGHLQFLEGRGGRTARRSQARDPDLARRKNSLLSVKQTQRWNHLGCSGVKLSVCHQKIPVSPAAPSLRWTEERQTVSPLFLSLVCCVFLSLLLPEDPGIRTFYTLNKNKNTQKNQ